MVGGGVGVVVVASPVAMVRWVAIMGMREREREKEEKQKRNKGVAGAREATASGTTGSDMRGE